MNVHHVELFYHVARHRGISAAVRHMPYGVQQPAVSSQITALERSLGVKLFERQPFALTPAGTELMAFAEPFFGHLAAMTERLKKSEALALRIGGSEAVLRDHLPAVLRAVKKSHPGLRLSIRTGFQPQLEELLRNGELDLALTTAMRSQCPPAMKWRILVRLPLVLLVHRSSRLRSAAELWTRKHLTEPRISSVPAPDSIFRKGLKRRGIVWPTTLETPSLELVTWYVAHGHGIGVSVNLPAFTSHRDVRVLPLEGFDPVLIVAMWRGKASAAIQALIDESVRHAQRNFPAFAAAG